MKRSTIFLYNQGMETFLSSEIKEEFYNSTKLKPLILFEYKKPTQLETIDWNNVFFYFKGGCVIHRYGSYDFHTTSAFQTFNNSSEFIAYCSEFRDRLDDRNHITSEETIIILCLKQFPKWKIYFDKIREAKFKKLWKQFYGTNIDAIKKK